MDRQQVHKLVDEIFDSLESTTNEVSEVKIEVKAPRSDGKRVARTKSTGDRVYLLDPENKTKQWVTSPEVLAKLGFELSDVEDLEDSELVEYRIAPSIFRIDG